jgi:hypothetical protein
MFTRLRFSPLLSAVRAGGACVLLAALAGRLAAGDFDVRNLQHEVMCREVLAGDPALGPLNLIVRVQDRVATLSGPVPTRELAQRAVQTLQKLPELREVRNQLLVQFADDGLLLPWPVKVTPKVPPPEPAKAPPEGVWKPVFPSDRVDVFKKGKDAGVTGTVSQTKDKPTEPPDAAAVSSAVQGLILGEEKYRRVRYEVKQGKVYLSGTVYRWADLQELARAVTHIPGVEGVVLKEVKMEQVKK